MNPVILLAAAAAAIVFLSKKDDSDSSNRSSNLSETDQRAHDKFSQLSDVTGDDQWNPRIRPLKEVITAFQVAQGASEADGVFDGTTEILLDDAIAGLAPQ